MGGWAGLVGRVLTALLLLVGGAGAAFAKVYVASFALDDSLQVFPGEAAISARVLARRWPGSSVTVTPRADVAAFRRVVASIASRMDRDRDVLIVVLVSHGTRSGIAVSQRRVTEILSPADVASALASVPNAAVIVSACYSGVFADALAGPGRLLVTAADSTHPSFGCKPGRRMTFFGEAFFGEALPGAASLRAAYDDARTRITAREQALGFAPSNPQFAGGSRILAALEQGRAERSSASAGPASPPPVAAGCDLRIEDSPDVPGCRIFNGYASGQRVGIFRLAGQRVVAAGGTCPAEWPRGTRLSSDRLRVESAVYTLTPDCRGSSRTTR